MDDVLSFAVFLLTGVPLIAMLSVLTPLLRLLRIFPRSLSIDEQSLAGKVVIVTGCNTGIGLQTAKLLAHKGAAVVMACRSVEKAAAAAAATSPGAGSFHPIELDLADLKSVTRFVRSFEDQFGASHLHALVCNAGVPAKLGTRTVQGFEMAFGVSFIGHFALVLELLPRLKRCGGRVVTLSSVMHRFAQPGCSANWNHAAFDTYPMHLRVFTSSYSDAKSAMVLLAVALRARGIASSAVNPGAAAVPCVAPIISAEPLEHLYLSPYWVPSRLPVLDLAGPFVGAFPNLSKPEQAGAQGVALDAERLWSWGETVLQASHDREAQSQLGRAS
ncbi:hypothetical protein AB1Y20_009442 [Prymnesium parvum]|uniref:Protochlorophyllide reductase n=1 Tax=Prymnesium parvum TaxID=97485 RepID=A0AB34K523_PRYPA